MAERNLQGADGLRTLACLMVVFHHLSQQLVLFHPEIAAPAPLLAVAQFFTSSGSAGVSVFFILSGFLLAMPFWRSYFAGEGLPSLRVYAARRAGRIMPGFYLNLFFFFLLGILFQPEAPAQLWRYFAGLTFTSGFHWVTFFPVEGNGPLWSIGFEVVSYVLLPLGMLGLFWLPRRTRSWKVGLGWWILVWLVVLALNGAVQSWFAPDDVGRGWQYGLLGGAKFWMPRYNPLGFFGHFSLGILAAGLAHWWSQSSWTQTKHRLFDLASLVLFGLWLALLISRTNQDQFSWNWQGQPYYFPAFPFLGALLLACLTQSRLMGKLFDNPFTRYTARISFGLYLWHTSVIACFSGSITDTAEWLILVLVTLLISYAVATLSWKKVEEPILRAVQKWKPRSKGERRPLVSPFSRNVVLAALVLIGVPLAIGAAIRPSAWSWPKPSEPVFFFNQPGPVTGLALDPQGGVWVAKNGSEIHHIRPDKQDDLIYRLSDATSDVRLSFSRFAWEPWREAVPSVSVYGGEKPWIWSLKRTEQGDLFVAAADRVLQVSPLGHLIKAWPLSMRGDFGVMDLVLANDGMLLVSSGDQVLSFDPKTGLSSPLILGGREGFRQAAGLALDPQGLLWVCAYDRLKPEQSRVLVYRMAGGQVGERLASIPVYGAFYVTPVAPGRAAVTSAGSRNLSLIGVDGQAVLNRYFNVGMLTAVSASPSGKPESNLWAGTVDGMIASVYLEGGSHD